MTHAVGIGRMWGGLALAFLLVFGLAFVVGGPARAGGLPPGGTFVDDDGNTHEGFIEAIAAAGITQGCDQSGTLYCPSDLVLRGQMASFIARGLELPAATSDFFTDDDGTTHEANINAIAEAGITLGFPDGTFQPDGFVSRAQMASFLARGLALGDATQDFFTDDDGTTHEANINKMAAAGITLGCDGSGTRYCPDDDVRRDQMASFIGRGLDLTEIVPPPPTTTTTEATTTTTDASTTTSEASTTTTTMSEPETVVVDVLDNFFQSASVTINAGDTVSFSKQTSGNHNVNFDDGSVADSGAPTTAVFTHDVTFDTSGVFSYVCDIHVGIGMTGTITVDG